MTPELQATLEKRIQQLKDTPLTGCGCSCHKSQREAQIKHYEARLRGGFFIRIEDCDCCLPSFGIVDK